jgi:sugar phosphate isomerase/epimerase
MHLLVMRSKWDMPDLPLPAFLERVKASGFDGTDIHFERPPKNPAEIADLHERHGLKLVAMVTSDGPTPEDHIRSLEQKLRSLPALHPVHVNCHTGRDIFSLSDNTEIFRRAVQLSRELNLPVSHETHRGRATYSAISTRDLLQAVPEMKLTADFSHWCCVHESLLSDQPEAVELAIQHTTYVHARVGHGEGPQVSDPRAPEWINEVEAHLGWWKRIATARKQQGAEFTAFCPEFGPAPYMTSLPFTRQPVADLWEITVHMKELIRRRCTP